MRISRASGLKTATGAATAKRTAEPASGCHANPVWPTGLSAIEALSGQPSPEQAYNLASIGEGVVTERVGRPDPAGVDDGNTEEMNPSLTTADHPPPRPPAERGPHTFMPNASCKS